jgi:ubiquitin carboxyl-terminal hydrolase 5/13
MIMDMGFTRNQGRKALLETGNDPNRAVEWLFSHPDDDGTTTNTETSSSSTSNENKKKSEESLGSNLLPAKYRLKSFISHKGPSVHSGHYVSHVWTGQADKTGQGKGSWVLFNDEKVVRAGGGGEGDASSSKVGDGSAVEWMEKAYVYLFERVEQ